MSGGMPYQLEKGPTFSVAESMLNGSYEHRSTLLGQMRAGTQATPSDTLPGLDSTTLDAGPQNTLDKRIEHMNKHWFGKRKVGGQWVDQAPFDPLAPERTGYWNGWYGDAEGILREAFIRALEVATGIAHDEPIPASAVRNWPIQVFWRCPAPWMEAWVTWASAAEPAPASYQSSAQAAASAGDGIVTVHVHTPSHDGSALLLGPRRQPPDDSAPDYADEPASAVASEGMWVVTHERHYQWPFYSTVSAQPKAKFQWPTFGPFVEGRGPVVVVQPSEKDGGVLAAKREYQPA